MTLTDTLRTPATPAAADALQDMSAVEIVRRIAARDLSAAEAVEHFIARLEAVNPKLNAVTVKLFDSARKRAAEVDQALSRGEKLGPLAGLPVTIKECFDVAGTATTFGLPSRRNEIENSNDRYVAALLAAGAIPIAKTNVPQLMIYTETDNPLYGRTNNPWNLERSCGGSSGGEGATIGAGASPLGLGSDIGGSLRIPAAFCGIASIKPTAGRVPDLCAHGWPNGQRAIGAQAGPMARHVKDVALGLRVLDGARDPLLDPGPELGDPATVDLARVRFAAFTDDGDFPVAPAVRRAVTEAAEILNKAGAKQIEWRPDLGRVNELFFAVLSADRAVAFRRLLRGNTVARQLRPLLLIARMPAWLRRFAGSVLEALGQRRSAATTRGFASGTVDEYWRTVEALGNFRKDLLRSLDDVGGGPIDVILCPAYPVPAIRHGATETMPMPGAYMTFANVTGFPAGIVPVTRVRAGEESNRPPSRDLVDRTARETERGSAGLPIAVQVIARPWCDHIALAAMAAIEAGARKQPDYPARPPL